MSTSTVASVLAKDLAHLGARRCFGLLGTANFKISHGLVEAGVELISARHEGNAASMADAYAKATGELTLVSVHSGPGLTNAITGIGEAAKSRTPLLVLAGDVPTGNVKSNFYFEQAELVRSVGAIPERTHTPLSARGDLLRAVTLALRDRQTVVLSLPLDVQDAKLNGTNAPLKLTPMPGRLQPDPQDVRRLAEVAARAKRPLVLAGRGAVLSDAESSLLALADRLGALVATSVCGHGLFADNPWSLGICGGFSSPAADELISESDFILGFGVSFTQWTTKKGKLIAPDATVAQIDIEAPKLGYQRPVHFAVLGDAKATAEALLAALGAAEKPGRRDDRTLLRLLRREERPREPGQRDCGDRLAKQEPGGDPVPRAAEAARLRQPPRARTTIPAIVRLLFIRVQDSRRSPKVKPQRLLTAGRAGLGKSVRQCLRLLANSTQ